MLLLLLLLLLLKKYLIKLAFVFNCIFYCFIFDFFRYFFVIMMMININLDDYFTRLNHLINKIELALKKCSKKYQDKREIDLLHSDLSVWICQILFIFWFVSHFKFCFKLIFFFHYLKSFLMQENLNDCKLNDELTLIEKELRKTSE